MQRYVPQFPLCIPLSRRPVKDERSVTRNPLLRPLAFVLVRPYGTSADASILEQRRSTLQLR